MYWNQAPSNASFCEKAEAVKLLKKKITNGVFYYQTFPWNEYGRNKSYKAHFPSRKNAEQETPPELIYMSAFISGLKAVQRRQHLPRAVHPPGVWSPATWCHWLPRCCWGRWRDCRTPWSGGRLGWCSERAKNCFLLSAVKKSGWEGKKVKERCSQQYLRKKNFWGQLQRTSFIQVILFHAPFISKGDSYYLGNNFHRLHFQSRLLNRNILQNPKKELDSRTVL